MISRQGIFLEYTSMAKQQGKIDGVSGVPILNVPEFTRLIRELFPTSQLINDSQNRQVFSGVAIKKDPDKDQKDTAEMSNNNGKVANGVGSPRVNGTKEDIPVKENGHNGTISYNEDSNHSQQSLDSVGGGKISHSGAQPPKVPPNHVANPVTNHVDEDGPANHVPVNGKSNASAATGGTPPTPAQTMAKDAQMVKNNVKSEVTDADHMTNDKSDRHSNGTTTDKTDSAVNGHSDKENDHDNKVMTGIIHFLIGSLFGAHQTDQEKWRDSLLLFLYRTTRLGLLWQMDRSSKSQSTTILRNVSNPKSVRRPRTF